MTEKRDRTAYYEEKLQKKVILATEQSLELQVSIINLQQKQSCWIFS